jgi:hypothetical protein
MKYLRLNKYLKVDRLDILYVRKVRSVEALSLDADGPIVTPVDPEAAVIVFADRKCPRIITPISFRAVLSKMAFVDIGDNRYVPALNIDELCLSPKEYDAERFTEVWLQGQPWSQCMTSTLPKYQLEERLDKAMRFQDILDRDEARKLAKRTVRVRVQMPSRPSVPAYQPAAMEYGLEMAA